MQDLGHDAVVCASWFDESVNVCASSSSTEPTSRPSAEPVHHVSLVKVPSLDDDDHQSVVSEKAPPCEGMHSVLRVLFYLCPSAAAEASPQPQRACEIEGLFGAAPKPVAGEVPASLFHRVAKLSSEARMQFQTALDTGKLPASGFPPRGKGPGSCSEPTLRTAAPFNSELFHMVGSLSTKRSVCFSFDEAAKVENLAKGILDEQLMSFWLFSTLLHLLRELSFMPSDPALFEQLVQALSMSFVDIASSAASLATYFQAKRREGVLSHFPSHVGLHFCRDLIGSSFSESYLFEEKVLARVIAASREDSYLNAQLSIAKAFSLPLFQGARNSDRQASSGQESAATSSASASRDRGRGYSDIWGGGGDVRLPRVQGSLMLPSLLVVEPRRRLSGGVLANRSYVLAQES